MPDTTMDQFAAACDLAREQNEYTAPERTRSAASAPSDATGDRPGDEFNRRASWAEILEAHGWKVDRTSGDVTYWTRPGKDRGVSATTGKCKSEQTGDLLYVFSGNAGPFEADTAYDKFGAYSLLDHNGDLSGAAKRLRELGYCKPDPKIFLRGLGAHIKDAGDRYPPDFDFATNVDLKRLDLGVRWVWDRWLQFGTVNLLAAEGGMGKTRFVADLCRRVNGGLEWPDGTAGLTWPNPYLAMWVAGDRNHGELVDLSESFGFGERICYSGTKKEPLGGVTLQTETEFKALFRKVKAAKPLFLVIDTAGGTTGFNLAKQEEARLFFAPLSDMAVELSLCVVVITHLNATKNVLGKRAEERVRTVIRMSGENREPETPRRIEVVKSNSLYPSAIGMTLGSAGNEYSTTEVPRAPDQMGRYDGAGTGDDGDPQRGPPGKVRDCMDWLTERLAERPARVSEIRTEAEENRNYSPDVLYKAVRALKIVQSQTQGYQWWALRKDVLGGD